LYRAIHVFMGFTVGLLVGGGSEFDIFYGLMGALGGYIPDLDLRIKHRKLLHNLIVPLILVSILYLATSLAIGIQWIVQVMLRGYLALVLGWILHVASDAFTKRGVYPLWPLNKEFKVALTPLKSTSIVGNFIAVLLSALAFYYWLDSTGISKWVVWFLEAVAELLGFSPA